MAFFAHVNFNSKFGKSKFWNVDKTEDLEHEQYTVFKRTDMKLQSVPKKYWHLLGGLA